jgi:hypothetical protein
MQVPTCWDDWERQENRPTEKATKCVGEILQEDCRRWVGSEENGVGARSRPSPSPRSRERREERETSRMPALPSKQQPASPLMSAACLRRDTSALPHVRMLFFSVGKN